MRFNETHQYTSLLTEIGLPASSTKLVFPSVLDPEFEPVWDEYTASRVVKDIKKTYPRLKALYFISMGFISLLEKLSPVTLDRSYRSLILYDPRPIHRRLTNWMHTTNLSSGLRTQRHIFNLRYQEVPILNAIKDVQTVGLVEFKMNGRRRLTEHLKATTVFRNVPKDLVDKSSYPLAATAIKRNDSWYTVSTGIKWVEVKVTRAKFDTLLLKYRYTVPIMLFLGSLGDTQFRRALTSRHKLLLQI